MLSLSRVIGAALLSFSALAADAAIVSFDSRNAFDAAFTGSVRETWEGFANGTTITDGSTFNGITYFISLESALVTSEFLSSTTPNALGRTPDGFFGPGDTITFTFAAPILAFGIDISTEGQTGGLYTATTNLGEIVPSLYDPFPDSRFGQFIGFSSDAPFSSVTITGDSEFGYVLDTLRAVDAPSNVPEPAGLALVALALLSLGAVARARGR